MKNIIILGAARAGKTTLAKMLHRKYNYSIISIDSFVSALSDGFPSLGITHSNTENKFKLLPKFIFSYMNKIINEYPEERFILEGWHVFPKDVIEIFSDMDVKIICLGYTKITCDEALNEIRKNETKNSYTIKMTDNKVKDLILNHINYSEILKNQCEENNIKYYDTSFDRKKVLEEAMNYLSK